MSKHWENIRPGLVMPQPPKHRTRMAVAVLLSILFTPVIALGVVYAMCRGMFAVGVALTEELFED